MAGNCASVEEFLVTYRDRNGHIVAFEHLRGRILKHAILTLAAVQIPETAESVTIERDVGVEGPSLDEEDAHVVPLRPHGF